MKIAFFVLAFLGAVICLMGISLGVEYAEHHTYADPSYIANSVRNPYAYPLDQAPLLKDTSGGLMVFLAFFTGGLIVFGIGIVGYAISKISIIPKEDTLERVEPDERM